MCPISSSVGPIFGGRGQVISGHLANRFGSPFGKNTKLLRGVIGSISTPNDYLNTVFDDHVVSLPGSCENNALLTVPTRKPSTGCSSLPAQEKSSPFYKKGISAFCRSSVQIETYSFG